MTAFYDPGCFNVHNMEQAKKIILTPEDSTTEERWRHETPYLGELIGQHLNLHPRLRVLDYGCGVGRMAKELIHRYGCSVVGVDLSASMRALAAAYVESDRFLACPPGPLLNDGLTEWHHVICIWSLQHILAVEDVLNVIESRLHRFGRIFVVNNHKRALPTNRHEWVDDGKDVRHLLQERFEERASGALDPQKTTPETSKYAFWAVYQRRV